MDTFDYQRSTLPSRLSTQRGASVPAQRYTAGAGEAMPPSPLSVRAVFRASRRYWWLILALWTVGVSGLGMLIFLKVRAQYSATSRLKVDPNVIDVYGMSSHAGGSSYMQTYVELIRSPSVFSAAASKDAVGQVPRIKYAADPVQELNKSIVVTILPSTDLIDVSTTSTSAQDAATIVNAVVEVFLTKNKEWSGKSVNAQVKMLETALEKVKGESSTLEANIKALAAAGHDANRSRVVMADKGDGIEKPARKVEEPNLDVEQYRRMLGMSHETQLELIMAQARLAEVERFTQEVSKQVPTKSPQGKIDPQVESRINADPEVRDFNAKHRIAYDKFKSLERNAVAGQADPGVSKAAQQSDRLAAEVNKARDRARLRIMAEAQVVGGGALPLGPELELQRVRAEVNQLTAKREALDGKLRTLKLETSKQMTEDVEARFLEDRRRFVSNNVNSIQTKLDSLKMEQTNEERIHQIDPARVETSPVSDKRKIYLATMPFGVLGAVLLLAVLLEIRSGRVADPEFLSARVPHEVFAIAPLPTARAALGSGIDRNEQRLARFVQSLDHLRVALCEGGTNGEGRCVMITSATGGEGKTTLSAHLAARCANAGTATLLIDADLRRGSLGRLLDVPAGLGLGDVLAGQVELDGGLISTQAGGFHFLSAGTPGIDPTRVLRSTRLAELIGQLRQMYDLIIIDTPPVLPVADALILGRWADGAVLTARYDASRLPLVERANRQIAAAGIPVLGVVINGVRGQDQAYGNYAYSHAYPGSREPLDDGMAAS